MLHRRLAGVAAALLLVLVTAGSAYAASPQSIYRDLADNGRLDGHYTRADIERALDLPSNVRTDAATGLPRRPIRVPAAAEGGSAETPAARSGRRLPFSSLDAALLVAGGAPLLLIGAGLRRRLQPSSDAQAVGG